MKNYLRESSRAATRTGIILFVLITFWIGCLCALCFSAERPVVNVPDNYRQSNWLSKYGSGSCVHASWISLLRWQGRHNTAEMWRKSYSGGEYPSTFESKIERAGMRWASTRTGDVSFLEWACRTRRGCSVTVMGGRHMVTLVHLDEEWACILDNNYTAKFIWAPRDEFIAEWQSSYGWAITPVYTPAAPAPNVYDDCSP